MLEPRIYKGEQGYMALLADIINKGVDIPDRTGVGCRAIFDAKLVYDESHPPWTTARSTPLRMAFEEFWFFLNGKTQTKELEEKGIFFWQGNTTREFLDNRGLSGLEEGDMGMAYGYQMRGFNKCLVASDDVVDQIADTHQILANDPYSRRILNIIWNPSASKYMALTPCHWAHQFVCLPNEKGEKVLYLKLINRSLDTLFGLSFAASQYYQYLMATAKLHNMKVGGLSIDLSHVHLYTNQIEYTKELLERDLGEQGIVNIKKELNTLDDLLSMTWDDFEVKDFEINKTPFKTERPPMAV